MSRQLSTFDPLGDLVPGTTLIEASAGTGKTYTITTLFMRLIVEQGLRIEEILVVTFTEAATSELRGRVRDRLRESLQIFQAGPSPGGDAEATAIRATLDEAQRAVAIRRLQRAIAAFDLAAISTIHGFCRRMLRDNAFESGVPFETELLSDEAPLLDEIVRDFWALEADQAPQDLFAWWTYKGSGPRDKGPNLSPQALGSLARSLAKARGARVIPAPAPRPVLGDDGWAPAIRSLKRVWDQHSVPLYELLAQAARDEVFNQSYRAGELASRMGTVDTWLGGDPIGRRRPPDALRMLTRERLYKGCYAKRREELPEHELIDMISAAWQLEERRRRALQPEARELKLRLAEVVRTELPARKEAAGVRSFDDLLHLLDEALQGDHQGLLRGAIRARYRAALIDEFQDTDPVQYRIFSELFAPRAEPSDSPTWLFLIGDPKQAIYGFRGADIRAYLGAATAAGRAFTLETNYRSDQPLVEAVNQVFSTHPAPFVDERIPYIQVRAHHQSERLVLPSGAEPPLKFGMYPWTQADENRRDRGRLRSGAVNEALPTAIAAEISEVLRSGATIDGRPVGPGDCAVLVRANWQAHKVQAALRQLGIPSVLHGGASVLESGEAEELRRLLEALAHPQDPGAVRAALATTLLGWTAPEIAALDEQESAWDEELERLRALAQRWQALGFVQAFRATLDHYGVRARLLALQDGERRMTNLLHLGELLHRAARDEELGPIPLLRWFDRRREDARELAEAAQVRLESDDEAVQCVTMHRAKGLQYPLVWCPWLWAGSHPRSGGTVRFFDPDDERLTLDLGSPNIDQHRELAAAEERIESMRLFYVALTRAVHQCRVVCAAASTVETSPLAWLVHRPQAPQPGVEGLALATRHVRGLDHARMEADLRELAERSNGAIALYPLSLVPGQPWRSARIAPPELAARTMPRSVDRRWRTASFSALTSKAVHHPMSEGADHDSAVGDLSPRRLAGGRRVTLAEFTRGAQAGTFLHKVLEDVDFQAPGELRSIVDKELLTHGLDPDTADTVIAGLAEVLATPLDGASLSLAALPRSQRLDEMEFLFPVAQDGAHLLSDRLAQVFRTEDAARPQLGLFEAGSGPTRPWPESWPDEVAALPFAPLKGFLKGFVDLIFVHDERWYLADYKSNHLGETSADYRIERLRESMAHSHYYLQYHLYAVALHRYLQARLPDYDYERHFGGVYYLYLRGMAPDSGTDSGVFFDLPSARLIDALDACLRGEA